MRKDLAKITEYVRSEKDAYFEKAMRDLRSIGPEAIKTHDRTTAEKLVAELIRAFWHWDAKVPLAKSRKEMREEEFERFLQEREKMRGRRDAVTELLLLLREVTDHMRSGRHGGKKEKGFARHLGEKIDECEMEWMLTAERRIAEGEQAGRWTVRVGD